MAWKNPNIVIFSPVFSHSLSPTTPSSPQKNSGQFQPHLRREEKSQTSLSSNDCHENLWLDRREKACLFFQVTWPLFSKVSFASAWQCLGARKRSWPRISQLTQGSGTAAGCSLSCQKGLPSGDVRDE